VYNPVIDEYSTMWPVEVVDDLECVDVEPEGEDVPKEEREWRQGRTFPDRRMGGTDGCGGLEGGQVPEMAVAFNIGCEGFIVARNDEWCVDVFCGVEGAPSCVECQ